MRGRFLRIAVLVLASSLAGCASTQLNYNTLDLASSSNDLITSQILYNLATFRTSPYAVPAQVSVPSGSATTTNAVTPTISGPTGPSVSTVLANSAAAPTFFSNSSTRSSGNGTVGASFGDQWSQNWTLTPLEDPDQLRRLRALYRFGSGVVADRNQFACEYPLVQKEQSGGSATGSSQSVNVYVNGTSTSSQNSSDKTASNVMYVYSPTILAACHPFDPGTPDPAFLKPPGCIICDTSAKTTRPSSQTTAFFGQAHKKGSEIDGISGANLQQNVVGSPIKGPCIQDGTTVSALGRNGSIFISKPAACDAKTTFAITAPVASQITFKGQTHNSGPDPTLIDGIAGAPLQPNVIGSPIKGRCIPDGTTVNALGPNGSVFISNPALCDVTAGFTVTVPAVSTKHVLDVNPDLGNDWLWDPSKGLPMPPDAARLGRYAGQDLYLYPGPNTRKEYSDFVLFVLEATLQSTTAGGATGKGTSQKGGTAPALQEKAQPAIQLLQ